MAEQIQPSEYSVFFPACLPTFILVILLILSDSPTLISSAPLVRTSFGDRSFSVAAPKFWNFLLPALRTCTSPDTFRRRLKTASRPSDPFPPSSCASYSPFADHCARLRSLPNYLRYVRICMKVAQRDIFSVCDIYLTYICYNCYWLFCCYCSFI